MPVGKVNEIGDTEPLDDLEGRGGGGEDGAHACGDDGDLHDQAQLQTQGVPVTTPEAILQAAGHRSDRSGPR
ncbi:hypothetical protein D3C71_1979250 [compost metagenome]